MGYHVTILRTNKERQLPIPLKDIISVTGSETGWQYFESPPTFYYQDANHNCTLWYDDGELWAKNPDESQIITMVALANALGARVRGDEWESYDSSGKEFSHPDDEKLRKAEELSSHALANSALNEQNKIRNIIILTFVLLGFAGYFVGKLLEN